MRIAFRLCAAGTLILGAWAGSSTTRESVPVAPGISRGGLAGSGHYERADFIVFADHGGCVARRRARFHPAADAAHGKNSHFSVTIPDGRVVEVSLPGDVSEALAEP